MRFEVLLILLAKRLVASPNFVSEKQLATPDEIV